MQEDDFESRKSPLAAHLCFAFVLEEQRATPFFSVEDVEFLSELVSVCGAYGNSSEHSVLGPDEVRSLDNGAFDVQGGAECSILGRTSYKICPPRISEFDRDWTVCSGSIFSFLNTLILCLSS